MGCDFYIIKLLRVYTSDSAYVEIELDRERGYYDDFQFDEDADDYDEKLSEHIRELLTPKVEPITIYSNNSWNKSSCEVKYKERIVDEITKHNKQWSDVVKVIKVEERHD